MSETQVAQVPLYNIYNKRCELNLFPQSHPHAVFNVHFIVSYLYSVFNLQTRKSRLIWCNSEINNHIFHAYKSERKIKVKNQ